MPESSAESNASDDPTFTERLAATIKPKDVVAIVSERAAFFGPCRVASPPRCGSYNVVFVVTQLQAPHSSLSVRIPAPETFDPRRFEADMEVMKRIGSDTSMPLPRVVVYATDGANLLGHPFAILSYIPGEPLSELWYTISITQQTSLLQQVGSAMMELRAFEFDKLGDLYVEGATGQLVVGAFRDRDQPEVGPDLLASDEVYPFRSSGPFDDTAKMYDAILAKLRSKGARDVGFLRLVALGLNRPDLSGPPFVLSYPDFDVQNVLVDPETMQLTGLIDWDGVSRTLPRAVGFARYPGWVTRDWDPLYYAWIDPLELEKHPEHYDLSHELLHREESPTELTAHRRSYLQHIRRSSPAIATAITSHSHVHEAIYLALHHPLNRDSIVGKLATYIFGGAASEVDPLFVSDAVEQSSWWAQRDEEASGP